MTRAQLVLVIAMAGCGAGVGTQPVTFGGPRLTAAPGTAGAPSSREPAAAPTPSEPAAAPTPAADDPVGPPAPSGGGACRAQDWHDAWPYLDHPADPWLAVLDGQPARVALPGRPSGSHGPGTAPCDAAHDHCLRDCTWLVTQSTGSNLDYVANPFHVGGDGRFHDASDLTHEPTPGFVAYRTVPATRANLRTGILAMALQPPALDAGHAPFEPSWQVGVVETIDWDAGTLRLSHHADPQFLSTARVVVLRYPDGGAVEAIAGVESVAPRVADVIQPGRRRPPIDPWAAVGRDGQPVVPVDDDPLHGFAEACDGASNHCLRPWVWFVDVGDRPVPARWNGTRFGHPSEPTTPIDGAGVAYRTRPAVRADLRPGLRVLLYDGPDQASERDAHAALYWSFVEVGAVDVGAGTFTERATGKRYPVDIARVLVVYWLAGDKAGKVE